MNNFLRVSILAVFFLSSAAKATPITQFKLIWSYDKLPLDVRIAEAPLSMESHVSDHGIVTPLSVLPIQKLLPDGVVKLAKTERAVLYLFVKNLGKKKLRFSVAPHSTEPGVSALGFSFNCLCNGHIYEVGPGEVWYRVMLLKGSKELAEESVTLKHVIFEVGSKAAQKPQAHLHHN